MLASGQPLPQGEPDTGREAASANRWQQGRMHEVLDADRTPEQGSPSCSGFFWLKDQIMRVCCGNRGKKADLAGLLVSGYDALQLHRITGNTSS